MTVHPVTVAELAELNPNEPAPPVLVPNSPGHDSLFEHAEGGHPERILPLIGNNHPTRWFPRPHTLDIVFDGGQQRVYTDSVSDALAVIIGGDYDTLAAHADDDIAADAAAFAARSAHAHTTRIAAQTTINNAADLAGLDSYEQRILTAACDDAEPAPGAYPSNHPLHDALYEVRTDGVHGEPVTIDQLLWNPPVRLVLSAADYAPYTDVPSPASIAERRVDGSDQPLVIPGDANLLWLRPDTEDDYLWSLHNAGVIAVEVRPIDQADPVFQDAWGHLNDDAE